MLSEQARNVIEEALIYRKNNAQLAAVLHKDVIKTIVDEVDAALAEVRALSQPQEPVPVEAIRKLICYGIPLGATNADWNQWRDSVAIWLDSSTKQVQP